MSGSTRFFGGALILILSFVFSVDTAFAVSLLQQTSNADCCGSVTTAAPVTQSIDCADVAGQVSDIDLYGYMTSGDTLHVDLDSQTSDTFTAPSTGYQVYSFNFASPVDCTSGVVNLDVIWETGTIIYLSGNNITQYPNGSCSETAPASCGGLADLYFEIYGTAGGGGGGGGGNPAPTGFATSTGTIQSGDIPFLLGVILVLLMYFFIWHVYGKLFNIWPLS